MVTRAGVGAAAFWVAVVSVFLFPYSATAHATCWGLAFPAATAVLVGLFALRERGAVLATLGVPRRVRPCLGSALVFVVLAVAFGAVIRATTGGDGGLRFETADLESRAAMVFQSLNEEMLLGFLALTALRRRLRSRVGAAVVLAAVFAVLHVAMYGLGTLRTWLEVETVVALFAVGVLRNALILRAGHVGYAWALHAGWNVTMLGGRWYRGGDVLAEPEVFDALLGHPVVVVGACVAAVGGLASISGQRQG